MKTGSEPQPTQVPPPGIIAWVAGFFTIAFLGVIVSVSALLRPIADDYIFGAKFSETGFLSPLSWFEVWSGDLFSTTLGTVLLGLPLAVLPIELGSSIAFLVAIFGVGIATSLVVVRAGSMPTSLVIPLTPPLSLSWLMAFWLAAALPIPEPRLPFSFLITNTNNVSSFFASGVTHWQTINVGYLTGPATLLSLLYIAYRLPRAKPIFRTSLIFLVAFFIGGSPTFAISCMVILPIAYYCLPSPANRLYWSQDSTITVAAIFTGVYFSLSSPGAVIRREVIQQGSQPDYMQKLQEAILGLPVAFVDWGFAVISVFSIFASMVGLLIGLLARGVQSIDTQNNYIARTSVLFMTSSLVVFLVSSALAKVTYQAWWHTLTGRLLLFVAATLLGVWLGQTFFQSKLSTSKLTVSITAISLVVCLGLASLVASKAFIESVEKRNQDWAIGDASLAGITDISSEWVLQDARKIKNPFWSLYEGRLLDKSR